MIFVWHLTLLLCLCCDINAFFRPQGAHWSVKVDRSFANFRWPLSASGKDGDQKDKFTEDNNDFITRLFGWAMPKPEQVGLNRYDRQSLPENYPAEKKRLAELLPSDNSENLKLIRPLLAQTNLETRKLTLTYSSKKQGFNAKNFHTAVDGKGPAVVLCKSALTGTLYGGYNPTGWINLGESRGNIAAFLYVFQGDGEGRIATKLAKIAGASFAQLDDGGGPRFGSEGLHIPLQRGNEKLCRIKLGLYYERMPDGSNTFLPARSMQDELEYFEVYTGVYAKDEMVPYAGAMFFQLN